MTIHVTVPRATTWPSVTFNTTRPEGMAAAEAWVRSMVGEERYFEGWGADETAPESPETSAEGSEGTQVPPDGKSPCSRCNGRGWICLHCGGREEWHHDMDCGTGDEEPCPRCCKPTRHRPDGMVDISQGPTECLQPWTALNDETRERVRAKWAAPEGPPAFSRHAPWIITPAFTRTTQTTEAE